MIIIRAHDLVREVRKALPGEEILERREGQVRINVAKKGKGTYSRQRTQHVQRACA